MKNTSYLIRTICEIGIFAALGFVFDELQGILFKGLFVNGGSIGFAMIAVLIVSYRRGFLPGLLTGLLMGLFDIATSAYIVHPMQLFLDYIFPYALVSVAGLLKPFFDKSSSKSSKILWLIAGTIIGGIAKFFSHYFAGVFFWSDPSGFAWNLESMNVFLYCFIYNIAFIGPSIVITGALLTVVYLTNPRVLTNAPLVESENSNKKNRLPLILSLIYIASGAFIFTFFLISYINSYESYQDGSAFGYDFDPDSMVIFILGAFLALLGVYCLFSYLRNKFSFLFTCIPLLAITSTSFIYGLSRLIRMYVKEKDPTIYWIWFAVSLVALLIVIAIFIASLMIRKKEKQLTV